MIAKRDLSFGELLAMECLIGLVFVLTLSYFASYNQSLGHAFDNWAYISIAQKIRAWNFSDISPKWFWGTSYAIAIVSTVFRLPEQFSLLVVSIVCAVGSIWLAFRMWGPWVAALFAVLNIPWIQLTFEGGSEPLFVFLIFSALFFARHESWSWAAFASSLATTVRPIGFMALVASGLVLLYEKSYRRFLVAVGIGLAVGFAYVLPLWIHFGDPLATYHGYGHDWDDGSTPVGLPFRHLIQGMLSSNRPITNLALNTGWILFAFIGLILLLARARQARKMPLLEYAFATLYLAFLFNL
jgi:hypothetical protein